MSKIKEALELSIELNQRDGGWSHHRELFYAAKDEFEVLELQRDNARQELREIRDAIKADENESTADEVRSLVAKRDEFRVRLSALEDIATAVEADIDCGRPLEYNVEELRAELIRARKALGILPEQEQTTTLGMEEDR